MSRLPSGSPRATLQRLRWFFGLALVQTAQPQPMTGTPWEVPLPRKSKVGR